MEMVDREMPGLKRQYSSALFVLENINFRLFCVFSLFVFLNRNLTFFPALKIKLLPIHSLNLVNWVLSKILQGKITLKNVYFFCLPDIRGGVGCVLFWFCCCWFCVVFFFFFQSRIKKVVVVESISIITWEEISQFLICWLHQKWLHT